MTAATGHAADDRPRAARRPRPRLPSVPGGIRPRLETARSRLTRAGATAVTRADPVLAQARRWMAPITRLGWAALWGGVAAVWVGIDQGWVEVLVLGVATLVAVALALLWTFGRMSYAAQIDLDSTRVTAGEQALGRVVVRNRATRTLLPSSIELPVGRRSRTFDLPGLGREEDHEILFAVPTRRRGIVPIGPVRSVKSDPFGCFRRERNWTERVDLYVHPPTVPIAASTTGFLRDIEGVTTHNLTSSDVAFHALRDYVNGDDLRTVHWRTTARVGKMMVRQFEETRRSHLLVMLSLRPDDYATPEELELAISTVGSLVLQARREERQVDVMTSSGRLPVPSAPALLDQLCGLDFAPRATPLRESVVHGLTLIPSTSMVVLVAGSAISPDDLHAAHRVVPLDVLTVAVRACGPEDLGARRRIGGMTVVDVPTLAELPRAMRVIR